ncbi:hypothetical protein DM02DRAFT_635021 [Periconia macrospinosa]|uniref:Uncharacterized protein n=1 Tax=Periconia macrospinosa TaxID=97972 RepID=A0A2V1D4A1_9PLEO|nr:hypothetical protein DM02DRAFT_635021 [Periconia macrospinosa]
MISLMSISIVYDIAASHITDADVRKLREDDYIPVSATDLKARTLGAARNRSRKHSLSYERSRAHGPTELDIPESFDDDAIYIPNEDLQRSQKSRTPNDTNMTQSEAAYPSLPQTKWGRSRPATPSMAVATASTINLPPHGPSPSFYLPAHYPTTELDIMRMQNMDAFRAQQQVSQNT